MSTVLTDKNILIIGEENSQIHILEKTLAGYGMKIHSLTCDSVSPQKIEELKIDLVFLNYLDKCQKCKEMLNSISLNSVSVAVPIFILVEENSENIQEALTLGAADYITSNENIDSVVQKMKAIFGSGDDFSGTAVIDITPIQASISSTGIRVFVVEDDPLLRNLLSIKLDKSSFPYEFSSDGKDAVPVMKQFKPDIVILDLMLPGKSGFEVLAEIKADDLLKDVPVLVFSNRDGQEDRKKAKELGAVGFYVKAMTDLSELIEMIESYTSTK